MNFWLLLRCLPWYKLKYIGPFDFSESYESWLYAPCQLYSLQIQSFNYLHSKFFPPFRYCIHHLCQRNRFCRLTYEIAIQVLGRFLYRFYYLWNTNITINVHNFSKKICISDRINIEIDTFYNHIVNIEIKV